MAILKCKMCGGNLEVTEETTVCECEYCGTRQTVPTLDDEKKFKLFERANKLRANCEFDKAAGVYENIVADYSEEAEGYWGLILCRYGIEYVDDPATGKKVPTCHRSSFDSIMDDEDFEMVMENSDAASRVVYREEAKYIEEVRKGIIEVSGKEDPYDIFICYKETDEYGNRTIDSVIAQDVYDVLTEKGYRVFFSRISLESKLGVEYEPYIFAALNSAKIMLAFGTSYDYYNAVWVKNEWSRYLRIMAKDKTKYLIPCFKNVDAYDIPKEFAKLQSQDMGKVGAVQDLLRGIEKILPKDGQKVEKQTAVTVSQLDTPGVASLIRRGHLFLEDGIWQEANKYFNQVLDIEPECAEAYLGLAMAKKGSHSKKEFSEAYLTVDCNDWLFQRAKKYADDALLMFLNQIEERRKETPKRLEKCRNDIKEASLLISVGWNHIVGMKSDGTVLAVGDNEYGQCNVSDWCDVVSVCCARANYTVGLKSDGTVLAVGDNEYGQCNVSNWCDVAAIFIAGTKTIGVKTDKTVLVTGDDSGISNWRDIVSVYDGRYNVLGIKSDGTVLATGKGHGLGGIRDWNDIVMVVSNLIYSVGLKSDGTVLASCFSILGEHNPNVSNWRDIVAINGAGGYLIGLKSNGTVLATGSPSSPIDSISDVSNWSDIVAISGGYKHIVGLKSDGTVLALGNNEYGQCSVSDWHDIVGIYANNECTIGLKSDGTVLATGEKYDVFDWKLFGNLDMMKEERKQVKARGEEECRRAKARKEELRREEERIVAEVRREEERIQAELRRKRIDALTKERTDLQAELVILKGLFTGKRRKEINTRLMWIESEIGKNSDV